MSILVRPLFYIEEFAVRHAAVGCYTDDAAKSNKQKSPSPKIAVAKISGGSGGEWRARTIPYGQRVQESTVRSTIRFLGSFCIVVVSQAMLRSLL